MLDCQKFGGKGVVRGGRIPRLYFKCVVDCAGGRYPSVYWVPPSAHAGASFAVTLVVHLL